jgi:hypothetical protein
MTDVLDWYAVRTIFRHQVTGETAVFEEKITLYRAKDAEAAIKLAEQNASNYLSINEGLVPIRRYGVYALGHSEPDLNGSEIWSHLSAGPADPEQFYREKHGKFDVGKS